MQKPLAQSLSVVQAPSNGQGAQVDPLELELDVELELELEAPADPVDVPPEPGLEQALEAERPAITKNPIHALFFIRISLAQRRRAARMLTDAPSKGTAAAPTSSGARG